MKEKSFRSNIAEKSIANATHEWLQGNISREERRSLPDFLISKLGDRITEWEVWIPLPNLILESTIPVPGGTFRPVTAETIDRWKERIPVAPNREKEHAQFEQLFESSRREFQGYASGVFSVTADSARADEVAMDLAQNALAALRLFHPGCLEPLARCATDLLYASMREEYAVSVAWAVLRQY